MIELIAQRHLTLSRSKMSISLAIALICIMVVPSIQSFAADSQSKASLADSLRRAEKGTQLHIFYVHGMGIDPPKAGTQDFQVSQEFRKSFCHQIGCSSKFEGRFYANQGDFDPQRATPPALSYLGEELWQPSTDEWRAAAPFVDNYSLTLKSGTAIYLHEINWWPLVLSAKCRQIVAQDAALVDRDHKHSSVCSAKTVADGDKRFKSYAWISEKDIRKREHRWFKAAVLNRLLKHNILDWGFADALLAVGPLHDYLIEGIREVILESFTPGENQEFIIVSHSLGSYLMFTAIDLGPESRASNLDQLKAPARERVQRWRPDFEKLLSNTSHAYFMANQVRLLELANLDQAKSGNLISHLQTWSDQRAAAHKAPPQVVAFSDPDDLLTWQLPHQVNKTDESGGTTLGVEDQPAKNAWRWPWLWLFANPQSAHIGYAQNKSVIRAMLPKKETASLK
jgi:hypothetical protein